MAKGDIILITFPFTDLTGSKLRPAIVLADSGADVTVAFITSQFKWQEPTDLLLMPTPGNGLKKPSLIRTNKLSTLDKSLIKGKIGTLAPDEIGYLNEKLKRMFQLD